MAINIKLLHTLAASALLCATSAMAQPDINHTVRTIVENNTDLKAMRADLSAQRNEASDANSLENPEVGFSRVWGHRDVGNKWDIDVSQSFDWPGLYRTRSKAADKAFSAGEMALAASELDIATQAKGLLIELVYVRKCIAVDNVLLSNVAEMQAAGDKAYEQGYATILDQRKLQIQRYTMESEIAAFAAREAEITAALQSLSPEAELQLGHIDAYPIEPVLTEADYMEQAASLDPALLSQHLTAETEGINAKAASQSRLPSFSVGLQHVNELGDNFTGFKLGMSLPFFQNRKARATAMIRQDRAEASARSILASTQAEISSKMQSMEIWRRGVDNYNRVFGDNSYLTLLKKALDGGEISIIEYLNETNYFHETTLVYLESEYNYNNALAWLNRYSLLSEI